MRTRLQEARALAVERRWSGSIVGMGGYSMVDPAAIPPPNMRSMNKAGVAITLHTAMEVDAVWTAQRIISDNIVKLGDLRAYKIGLSKDNVPYKEWLSTQPPILTNTYSNGWQTVGMDQTVRSMALLGEVFWYVLDRDRLQYPTVVEVLHPGLVDVQVDDNQNVTYRYHTRTGKVQLQTDNVIHLPKASMPGAPRGLNPIDYSSTNLALHLASLEFGARFFSQGSSPGYALTTDANPSMDEVRRLAQNYVIQHAGLTNSHLPLILTNGLKATQMQMGPDEAQYNQTLDSARASIAAYFGIPLHMINSAADKGNPYAIGATEEMMRFFTTNTLAGYIVRIEELYSKCLPSNTFAAFDLSRLSHPDAQSLGDLVMAMRNTQSMSINDVRTRQLGLPPLPDPQADDPLAPLASNVSPDQTDNGPGTQEVEPPEGKE